MAYSRIRFEIQNSATMTLVQSQVGRDMRFAVEQVNDERTAEGKAA